MGKTVILTFLTFKKESQGLRVEMKQSKKRGPSIEEGQLRVIGGEWRGRKLTFKAVDGLRPTPDRVRETLFNWLAMVLPGTSCIDLFAGSGALGLEALSRGAAEVMFVEKSNVAATQLKENLKKLDSSNGRVETMPAQQFLSQLSQPVGLVFLDPPFRQGLLEPCIDLLSQPGMLVEGGWVYIETGIDEVLPELPGHWQLHRQKTAGQVCYRLFQNQASLGL